MSAPTDAENVNSRDESLNLDKASHCGRLGHLQSLAPMGRVLKPMHFSSILTESGAPCNARVNEASLTSEKKPRLRLHCLTLEMCTLQPNQTMQQLSSREGVVIAYLHAYFGFGTECCIAFRSARPS